MRGKKAVFCSSLCRERWRLDESHELSNRPQGAGRRRLRKTKLEERRADESLKGYLDAQTTLSRINLEEKLRG